MRFVVLTILLTILIPTISLTETSNNLVSQDFTTGWSGTNVGTTHGNDTIAGVNSQYVESDSVSLSNDLELNKPTINNGFTITGSSEIWFWNSYTQSVTQTIKTVDDNGNIITQNRIISGVQNGYQTYSDKLIVSSNTQSDYDITLRYDFSVPGTTGHYGADLKNPSLTVDYTYKAEIDTTTENLLTSLTDEITEDLYFKDLSFDNEKLVDFKDEPTDMKFEEEPMIEEFTEVMEEPIMEEMQEEKPIDNSTDEGIIDIVEEESKEEEKPMEMMAEILEEESKDEEPEEVTEEESNGEATETADASEESNTKQKTVQSKETNKFKHTAILDKIDEKIKDVGKNLELKNLVTLKAMSESDILLSEYNVPFYKPKDIYLDQVNISDNRDIYNNITLNKYVQADPISTKINKINELKIERQQLLIQLEVLKNEL
jgi:hypothetical protein